MPPNELRPKHEDLLGRTRIATQPSLPGERQHDLAGDGMDVTRDMSVPTKQAVVRHLLASPLVRAKLLFLFASFVSLILSVSLWFSGHQLQGIFVGIWVPSILAAGALVLSGDVSRS